MASSAPKDIGLAECVALLERLNHLNGRHDALLVRLADLQAAYTELDVSIQDLSARVQELGTTEPSWPSRSSLDHLGVVYGRGGGSTGGGDVDLLLGDVDLHRRGGAGQAADAGQGGSGLSTGAHAQSRLSQ